MGNFGFDPSILQVIAWIGMAVSSWFSLTCAYSGWEFFTRRQREDAPSPDWTPAVTIFKPLKGLDPQLYENLSTFCRQDYPRFQLVFGIADRQDPAVSVVRMLQRDYPTLDIDLIIDGRLYGTNHKVSNLINMYRSAKHDILVLSDGDIRVPRDYLRRVVAPLRDESIGLVTCMYRAVAVQSDLPTLLWCWTINATLTPQILGARKVEKPTYAFGATMALRRSTLEAIHGFEEIANMLADDYQLGNRIAARGLRLWLSEWSTRFSRSARGGDFFSTNSAARARTAATVPSATSSRC
jgi:ceramide glucosyltransferase